MIMKNLYNKLDEEYKKKRFTSYEDFASFAISNARENLNKQLTSFNKEQYDDYTRYIMVDQDNNYYIFNVQMLCNIL